MRAFLREREQELLQSLSRLDRKQKWPLAAICGFPLLSALFYIILADISFYSENSIDFGNVTNETELQQNRENNFPMNSWHYSISAVLLFPIIALFNMADPIIILLKRENYSLKTLLSFRIFILIHDFVYCFYSSEIRGFHHSVHGYKFWTAYTEIDSVDPRTVLCWFVIVLNPIIMITSSYIVKNELLILLPSLNTSPQNSRLDEELKLMESHATAYNTKVAEYEEQIRSLSSSLTAKTTELENVIAEKNEEVSKRLECEDKVSALLYKQDELNFEMLKNKEAQQKLAETVDEQTRKIAELRAERAGGQQCTICLDQTSDANRQVVFSNCGHWCCSQCAQNNLEHCHLCRANISSQQIVFD